MTEKPAWWKVFLPKKKNSDKEPSAFGPDFNPWAQADILKDPTRTPKLSTIDQSIPAQGTNLLSDETFDDSKLDSVFNEQTCRRNMKVSRSGRFKEKRRPRTILAIDEKAREGAASGKEDKL